MQHDKCATCTWWVENKNSQIFGASHKTGQCHFNPPQTFGGGGYTKFPETSETEWCSKHQPDWERQITPKQETPDLVVGENK